VRSTTLITDLRSTIEGRVCELLEAHRGLLGEPLRGVA
jgi:hypothetical protein